MHLISLIDTMNFFMPQYRFNTHLKRMGYSKIIYIMNVYQLIYQLK